MVKLNVGSGLSGAASGATLGGSIGGGPGAAIGGGIGGLLGLFGGGQKKPQQQSTLDPKQRALLDEYLTAAQTGQGPLAELFGPTDMTGYQNFFQRNFADPALQRFKEEIIPNITGQFRGAGLGQSSYLGEALGKAGTDVQKGLDDKLADILFQAEQGTKQNRRGAVENILGMNTLAQGRPRNTAIQDILNNLGPAAGNLLGNYLSGGQSNANQNLASLFGGGQQMAGYKGYGG